MTEVEWLDSMVPASLRGEQRWPGEFPEERASLVRTLDAEARSNQPRNVILAGQVGTGKSSCMACMAYAAATQGKPVYWISGMEFEEQLWNASTGKEVRPEFDASIQPAIWCVDDIGTQDKPLHDLVKARFAAFLDKRNAAGKATWITMNSREGLPPRDLFGDRAWERLYHNAVLADFAWDSFRAPAVIL